MDELGVSFYAVEIIQRHSGLGPIQRKECRIFGILKSFACPSGYTGIEASE